MFKYRKVPKHWKYLLTEGYILWLKYSPENLSIDTGFIKVSKSHSFPFLTVEERYAWDGPSGPTIDTKSFMRGSLIHDALYQLMREGHLDRKVWRLYADKLLRKLCLEDGMSKFRAWYVYNAVRLFAAGSTKER